MTTSTVDVLSGAGTVCRHGDVNLWVGDDVPEDLAGRLIDAVAAASALVGTDVLGDLRLLLAEVPPGAVGSLAAVAVSTTGITAVLHGAVVVQNGRGEAHSGVLTSQVLHVDVAADGLVGVWGAAGPPPVSTEPSRFDLQAGTVRGGGMIIRTPDLPSLGEPPVPSIPVAVPAVAADGAAAGAAVAADAGVAGAGAGVAAAGAGVAGAAGAVDDDPTPSPGRAVVAPAAVAEPVVAEPIPAPAPPPQPPAQPRFHPGANGTPEAGPPVRRQAPPAARRSGLQLLDLQAPPVERPALSIARDVVEPPPVDEPRSVREVVQGIRCINGHFNHQGMLYCRACGIGMVQQSAVLVEGERPSLGVIVMGDGSTFNLDDEYVLGREPSREAGVRSIVVDDRRVSRRHALLSLNGWDVQVTDLGSSNGTYLKNPGWAEWVRATPHQSVTIEPGGQIGLGGQVLVYESSVRRS